MWPQDDALDCKHNLSSPCLVDNNTCGRIPANLTFITISDECSCGFYNIANCSDFTAQSFDGVAVTDAILYGTIRYYRCHRIDQESGSGQMLEVGLGSFLVGIVLAVVLSGL
ncbi:hypothetical protein PSPO01_07471 [Paraphaeosphaeria sporulosa]